MTLIAILILRMSGQRARHATTYADLSPLQQWAFRRLSACNIRSTRRLGVSVDEAAVSIRALGDSARALSSHLG